ncbi:MAG: hypothetical protein HY958_06110 [Bacteroidia bacterium]|nr:hypothetical protein [Bacteroidia bacterium]
MFSSPDSKDYLAVGNWIFEQKETIQTMFNPFMFPLLLKFFLIIGGVKGVWLFQFFLWIGSINLLFFSLKRASNIFMAFIGTILFSINLSYIALTLHALADVTSTFIISWLIFYLTGKSFDFKKAQCFYILVLFFSILSGIKPIFFPILIFCIAIVFPLFYLKSFLRDTKKYLLLIVLIPVIIQFSIMVVRHHTFSLSTKGLFTLNQYFFAQGYAAAENITIDEARPIIKDKSLGFMLPYMLNHLQIFSSNFKDNIILENLKGPPTFLAYPPEYKHQLFYTFMDKLNKLFFQFHLLFILPCLFLLYYLAKRHSSLLKYYLVFYVLFWYLVLMTGIAFWQGDRYNISFEPFWIIMYAMVIHQLTCTTLTKLKININIKTKRMQKGMDSNQN